VKDQRTALGLGMLALLGLLVWLTPYRYERVTFGQGVGTISRTNRLTGKTELLSLQRGWIPVGSYLWADVFPRPQ
jgi:hypothetical protein